MSEVTVSSSFFYLIAGITLCLWGDPKSGSKGLWYLTPETRQLLEEAMKADSEIRKAMRTLTTLIAFGPDARAGGDWLVTAIGHCTSQKASVLTEDHLLATALHVLAHKVRETYNEGAEPDKVQLKEECIYRIVSAGLKNEKVKSIFLTHYQTSTNINQLADTLFPSYRARSTQQKIKDLLQKLPASRREPWIKALELLPDFCTEENFREWQKKASDLEALPKDGYFRTQEERAFFIEILKMRKDKMIQTVEKWPCENSISIQEFVNVYHVFRPLQTILVHLSRRYARLLTSPQTEELWLTSLAEILIPYSVSSMEKDRILWSKEYKMLQNSRNYQSVLDLMERSFKTLPCDMNAVGKKRCNSTIERIRKLRTIEETIDALAKTMSHDPKKSANISIRIRGKIQGLFYAIKKEILEADILEMICFILQNLRKKEDNHNLQIIEFATQLMNSCPSQGIRNYITLFGRSEETLLQTVFKVAQHPLVYSGSFPLWEKLEPIMSNPKDMQAFQHALHLDAGYDSEVQRDCFCTLLEPTPYKKWAKQVPIARYEELCSTQEHKIKE